MSGHAESCPLFAGECTLHIPFQVAASEFIKRRALDGTIDLIGNSQKLELSVGG